jgi:septal ring factor EnvC (AmiA/AmiB activator)
MLLRLSPAHGAFALAGLAALLILLPRAEAAGGQMLALANSFTDPADAREAVTRAEREAKDAAQRAQRLEREAQQASDTADQSAREAAALAARIQQAEADILAAQARYALIADQRRALDSRLAEQQQPLVQLTAALQNIARRPLVLSAFQPGSLKETVYVRAVLETTAPAIRARTSGLRQDLERGRALEQQAIESLALLRNGESLLARRRNELNALAAQQRLASREARQIAQRESERALELTEDARDLDALVRELDRAGGLRAKLAALPGPLIRPPRPGASQVMDRGLTSPATRPTGLPSALQLPVQGRTLSGFGEGDSSGLASTGLRLNPASGAQVIAPAAGRVAYAGPYRGYGRIVIIEHGNGFTSLVTGLARINIAAGDRVIGGSPIGNAPVRNPAITLELRRDGEPVNPLEYM